MKRGLALLFLGLLAASIAASPVAAQNAGNGTTTNETVQDLRERVQDLQSKNADLKAEVTGLNNQVQKLQDQLQQSGPSLSNEMKALGAWHPKKDKPAVLYLSVQQPGEKDPEKRYGLFQYCGPGNGNFDFDNDGVKAWCEIPIQKAGDTPIGPIRIELKYAPTGMNTTYEFAQSNAKSEIETLARRMNDDSGFVAWTQWNNELRQSAESTEGNSYLAFGGVTLLLVVGAMYVEARGHYLEDRLREEVLRRKGSQLDRRGHTSRIDSIVSYLKAVPVLGDLVGLIADFVNRLRGGRR